LLIYVSARREDCGIAEVMDNSRGTTDTSVVRQMR